MFLTYQYRLYPLRSQLPLLEHALSELTLLWNHALSERQDAWRKERRRIAYLEQQSALKRWRNFDSWGLGRLPYNAARDCLQRLDLAYRAAFRRQRQGSRRPGFPRFRRLTQSMTFPPRSPPLVVGRAGTYRLRVPRLGELPVRLHRPPPSGGVPKSVTVSHEADGAWCASIVYELPEPPRPPDVAPMAAVGVDLGLRPLATLSTGVRVGAPKFLAAAERRIAQAQRRLSRKKRGSHRYERQRLRLARLHAKVRRQRRWFAHQLSHDIAERYDLVAFEDLDSRQFSECNPLAKWLQDAGWGMLRRMARYKLALRSKVILLVPTAGTTQTCSACGRLASPRLSLRDRIYRCPCGYVGDRDLNAARNILDRGLALRFEELRRRTAEETRVESGPPPDPRRGRRAYSRNRELTVQWVIIEFPEPKWLEGLSGIFPLPNS
ncbi:MAG TPA: transposase [Thermoplasmata archaeon]|nr:transposase [Thermoplasmata archaeon]